VRRLDCRAELLWFLERALARRLLQGRSRGPAFEAEALKLLGCEPDQDDRLSRMLLDLRLSTAVRGDLQAYQVVAPNQPFGYSRPSSPPHHRFQTPVSLPHRLQNLTSHLFRVLAARAPLPLQPGCGR
jgi:hypothetical protein